ncbi:MAG: hypothetical protein HYX35_03540 [Proteobacteria bacterium]|nr:hypothetical protein [Pseudomonadota bacterium]
MKKILYAALFMELMSTAEAQPLPNPFTENATLTQIQEALPSIATTLKNTLENETYVLLVQTCQEDPSVPYCTNLVTANQAAVAAQKAIDTPVLQKIMTDLLGQLPSPLTGESTFSTILSSCTNSDAPYCVSAQLLLTNIQLPNEAVVTANAALFMANCVFHKGGSGCPTPSAGAATPKATTPHPIGNTPKAPAQKTK